MDNLKAISRIVGVTVAFFPQQVAEMLDRNGVTLNAKSYNSGQLVNATIDGLVSSQKFAKEFSDFVESNK